MGGTAGNAGQVELDGPIAAPPDSQIKPGDKGDGGSGGRGTPPGAPGKPWDEADSSPTASIPEKPDEAKLAQWTVMVYGAGDVEVESGLYGQEAKMTRQIKQLEEVDWSTRSVNLLYLLDRRPGNYYKEVAMPPEEIADGYWDETRMGWINYDPAG
jgi:hypothetical protein